MQQRVKYIYRTQKNPSLLRVLNKLGFFVCLSSLVSSVLLVYSYLFDLSTKCKTKWREWLGLAMLHLLRRVEAE